MNNARRVASVCSGAFILAATGELKQKTATTHWDRYEEFKASHPEVKLDIDAPDASEEYLERGYDEEKKMHYYKVFFNEET